MGFINNRDRFGALLILVFSLFYLRYIFDIQIDPTTSGEYFSAKTLPKGLAAVTILLCLFQLLIGNSNNGDEQRISAAIKGYRFKVTGLLIGLMLGYSLLFTFLGFSIATFLFLFLGFCVLGERRLWLSATVAACVVLVMWGLLTQVLGLYLDGGDIYRMMVGNS